MELEEELEQLRLRYADTWVRHADYGAVYVYDFMLENDEILAEVGVYDNTKRNRRRGIGTVSVDALDFNVWRNHSVLWIERAKGVVVIERSPERQIKRGISGRSMNVVAAATPHRIETGDIAHAMMQPVVYNVRDAFDMMRKDKGVTSVPISRHAFVSNNKQIYYGTKSLGPVNKAKSSPLWPLINKEAMA